MKKIIVGLLLWLVASPTLAMDGGVGVSPPFSEVVVKKGEQKKSVVIKYTNNTDDLISLKLKVVDFGALDEAGGVAFLGLNKDNLEKKYSLASWMSLSTDYLNIDRGKSVEVRATVLNKESLSPGGHYGAVLATLEQAAKTEGKKVAVNQSYAALFYVNKEGGEVFGLKFNQLTTEGIETNLNTKVRLRLQNSGNVHLVPRGLVTVMSRGGEEMARGVINSESAIVLPETFRWFNVNLTNEKKWIMPGKYKLVAKFRYDGKNDFETRETSFVYVGKMGGLFIVLGLIPFIVLIWRRKHI